MAKSNKHKLLHTSLIVIGAILFIIALWAFAVPHFTCKEGDCQWSFIGTNYSCDTCHKKTKVSSTQPNMKSNAEEKKITDNTEVNKKPKEIINSNEVVVQQNPSHNNCTPFYNNDYIYSNVVYPYFPQSRLYLPYYYNRYNVNPYVHYRDDNGVKNVNHNINNIYNNLPNKDTETPKKPLNNLKIPETVQKTPISNSQVQETSPKISDNIPKPQQFKMSDMSINNFQQPMLSSDIVPKI
tara:strand:- start:1643 stop:2359 length:717 start_codon:yes stop_codon:yes gene_type:complete